MWENPTISMVPFMISRIWRPKKVLPLKNGTFEDDDLIFPFIFVQSGIKPIVCTAQVKAFASFAESLEKAEEVIFLGYGFSSDDEHIINMVRERLARGDSVTIFLYKNEGRERIKKLFSGCKAKPKLESFVEVGDFAEKLNSILNQEGAYSKEWWTQNPSMGPLKYFSKYFTSKNPQRYFGKSAVRLHICIRFGFN